MREAGRRSHQNTGPGLTEQRHILTDAEMKSMIADVRRLGDPARGEIVQHPLGFDFEVLDADPRRIKRLRLRGLPSAAAHG